MPARIGDEAVGLDIRMQADSFQLAQALTLSFFLPLVGRFRVSAFTGVSGVLAMESFIGEWTRACIL